MVAYINASKVMKRWNNSGRQQALEDWISSDLGLNSHYPLVHSPQNYIIHYRHVTSFQTSHCLRSLIDAEFHKLILGIGFVFFVDKYDSEIWVEIRIQHLIIITHIIRKVSSSPYFGEEQDTLITLGLTTIQS